MEEIITIRRDQAVTSSLQVAKDFGKKHKVVLRAIETIESNICKVESNSDRHKIAPIKFIKTTYKDEQGRTSNVLYDP